MCSARAPRSSATRLLPIRRLLEASAALARTTQLEGRAVSLGQEGLSYNHIVLGYNFVWRQGNVVSFLNANLGRGPGSDGNDYVQLANSRVLGPSSSRRSGTASGREACDRDAARPARPAEGRQAFRATFRVTWSNNGAPVTSASVATKASIAAKTLPHRYSYGAGRLTMSLTVPRAVKGRKLKLTATVRAEGRHDNEDSTYTVR